MKSKYLSPSYTYALDNRSLFRSTQSEFIRGNMSGYRRESDFMNAYGWYRHLYYLWVVTLIQSPNTPTLKI